MPKNQIGLLKKKKKNAFQSDENELAHNWTDW